MSGTLGISPIRAVGVLGVLRAVRSVMTGRIIVDPFGMVNAAHAAELGFDHYRLGARPVLAKT